MPHSAAIYCTGLDVKRSRAIPLSMRCFLIHHLVSEDLRSCCDKEYEEYRLQFIASGILSVLQYWHSNGRQESPEQLLHKIKCILTTPLGSLLEFVDM